MLQPLKEKKHSPSEIFPIPLICAVCLIAPTFAISTPSHVLPEGSTGTSLHCTLHDQMNWSKASSAADFPQPTPRRCLWSHCMEGRQDPCLWLSVINHSLAIEHSNLFQAKKLLMDYSKPSRTYCCVCGQHGHKAFLFRQKTFDSEQFQDLYFCKAP